MIKDIGEIRQLIETGWCQGAYARNSAGDSVPSYSSEAVTFCLMGAYIWVMRKGGKMSMIDNPSWGNDFSSPESLLNFLISFFEGKISILAEFNDNPNTTKKDVLAFLDRAKTECVARGLA